jgi:hypothetical protein
MSEHKLVWLILLPVLMLACETVRAQNAPPACVAAKLAAYSGLECTVNNLDFKFDKSTFARSPDPKTIDVMPVTNPDGLRFVLPAIPKDDSDPTAVQDETFTPLFIRFNPTFSYHVKPLNKPITGVIVEGRTPHRNKNSGEPSRNAELVFAPGTAPRRIDRLRLVLFDTAVKQLARPIAVGQQLKAGDEMTFVNEAGTPSFPFTNRFPSD